MLNYLVIGLCLALLIAVIYFSIKPISMGIEARRNLKDTTPEDIDEITNNFQEKLENENGDKTYISEEIVRLNKLKNDVKEFRSGNVVIKRSQTLFIADITSNPNIKSDLGKFIIVQINMFRKLLSLIKKK